MIPLSSAKPIDSPLRVRRAGAVSSAQAEILTPEALAFVASLHRTFDTTRKEVGRRSSPASLTARLTASS